MTCMALMLTAASALAQGHKVKASLEDADNGESVAFATVSLTPEGSDKAQNYTLSTAEGKVVIEKVRRGTYTFRTELLGYKSFTKKITVEGSDLDLGTIKLYTDAQQLEAAKVTDIGNQITVKKDTIEYNTAMIKTSDNDMLIDLLKKLPGIEVDSDGSITANGKTIKKITIDGKTFFLDDPQLATKNIPSKIIDKVKVVDKKSDQALFTGIDDGEEETIIDLGVKKGMMKGWFGNIMAGGGHDIPSKNNSMNDWRYQGAGFIANFTDKQQISIILNGNNTNNRGFNDLAGSMMGGMRGGGRGGWGNNDGGITTSWMAGVNGAWSLLDNRMDLAGNYLYNGSIKDVEESSIRNTFVNDNETLNYNTTGKNHTFTNGHRVGLRIDHKFSDNTSILFEPQFNIGNGNYVESSDFVTTRSFNDQPGYTEGVNNGFTRNNGQNKNWTASGWGLLRQRLGKAGRTMTVNFRYNFSNNDLGGFNRSLTRTEDLTADPEIVNQRFDQNAKGRSVTGGLTYTEPLYKDILFLEANYSYTWNNQTSYKNTFMSDLNDPDNLVYIPGAAGEILDPTYSNSIKNTSHNHRAGANLMYQKDALNIQLGASANPTKTINETYAAQTLKKYENNVLNWAPQMSIRYELGETSNLRFNYWGRSQQPSTNQLMPVPDNSDPLRVGLGNPYLTPYFSHSFRGMYRFSDRKTFASVNAFLDGGITQNPIINTSWYEDDGRQFSLPSNGPAAYNVNMRVMVNSPLGKSKFSIFNMFRLGYNHNSNYVKTGKALDMSQYYDDGVFDYEKFHTDVPDLGQHPDFSTNINQTLSFTERFRLTYRTELVEINAGARTRMNKGWYSVTKGNTNATWNNQAEISMNWNIPGNVAIIPEYQYNWYNGYTTAQRDVHMLNLEVTAQLAKGLLTLGVKGYDLLGQSRNLSVSDTANYHSESVNNTLGRYVILSLTVRFGSFGGKRGGQFGGPGQGAPGGRGGYGGGRGRF